MGEGGFFFVFGSTLIDAHTLPGQTEGLKGWLRNGWLGWLRRDGWVGWLRRDGWFAKVDNGFLRLGGFAKVDNRFGYEKWLQGGCKGQVSSI